MSLTAIRRRFMQGLAAGLIKVISVSGEWVHLGYHAFKLAPNPTCKDFTCDFDKPVENISMRKAI